MKRFLKIVGIILAIIIAIALAAVGYFFIKYPDVDAAPVITVEKTPERFERGKYLVEHVVVCLDCHSTRDWSKFAGPIIPGTEGKGGMHFDEAMGFPGVIVAKNITPAGIGAMTDGELFRVLTSGVRKDKSPLFPLMPYLAYTQLSEEDLYSIITFIRTLKPIENVVDETKLKFPLNFIVRTIPTHHTPAQEPNSTNPYEYGRYLVTAAGCIDCHSMQKEGKFVAGMEFAGGFELSFPQGVVRSANITADEETGIGLWTKEFFVSRFKEYATPESKSMSADSVGYYSFMPWTMFSGMTEEDLGAVYTYLRTLPPVKHKIERFTPAKKTP